MQKVPRNNKKSLEIQKVSTTLSSIFWKALFGDAGANILLGSPVETSVRGLKCPELLESGVIFGKLSDVPGKNF